MKSNLIAALALILLISSCATEDEELDDRDKFTGSWICTETDQTGARSTFTITFAKTGVADSMLITNFAQLSNQKALVIINGNSLSFPVQTIDGFTLSQASGNYSNQKITMSYKLDNDQFTAECKR